MVPFPFQKRAFRNALSQKSHSGTFVVTTPCIDGSAMPFRASPSISASQIVVNVQILLCQCHHSISAESQCQNPQHQSPYGHDDECQASFDQPKEERKREIDDVHDSSTEWFGPYSHGSSRRWKLGCEFGRDIRHLGQERLEGSFLGVVCTRGHCVVWWLI